MEMNRLLLPLNAIFLSSLPALTGAVQNFQASIIDVGEKEYELTFEWDHDPVTAVMVSGSYNAQSSNPRYSGPCGLGSAEVSPVDNLPYWYPRLFNKDVSAEITAKTGIQYASMDWQPCGHKDIVICHAESHYDIHLYYVTKQDQAKMDCELGPPEGQSQTALPVCKDSKNVSANHDYFKLIKKNLPSRGLITDQQASNPHTGNTNHSAGPQSPLKNHEFNFCVDPSSGIMRSGMHFGDKTETLNEWRSPVTIIGSHDCKMSFFEPMVSWNWITNKKGGDLSWPVWETRELEYTEKTFTSLPTSWSIRVSPGCKQCTSAATTVAQCDCHIKLVLRGDRCDVAGADCTVKKECVGCNDLNTVDCLTGQPYASPWDGPEDCTPPPNIVETAAATPHLSTLVTALQTAQLVSTLEGPGPFTVFAPTNDAFNALPAGLLSWLLMPENKADLVKLLTYHVASGAVASQTITDGQEILTLEGGKVSASVTTGTVMISGATVTTANINASNGLVHIIDKVLIPPGANFPMKTIPELATDTATLSTLVTALQAADLVTTLSLPGPFTVFAPTNDAFNALPAGLLDTLLRPENKTDLVNVLTYHVASGRTMSQDISNGQKIMTLEGNTVEAKVSGSVMINDATVTLADQAASNGVVHIIDKVLMPPSTTITNTVVDLAVATADLSTLVTALQAADLVSTLSVPGPFTVFAPTNDAFNALPAGLLDSLLRPEGKAQLVQLLTYHVASGNVKAQDISDGQQIATLDGGNYVTAAVSGGAVMLNDASVTVPDQVASNGVVHIINKVLIPPGIGLALKTIPEVVTDTPTLSTLLSALRTADLVTTLSGAGPFTVFAPTDTAFYALPAGLLDMLLEPANKAKLVQLLQYHVVSGDVGSKAISDGQQITTLEGSTVSATVSGASVKINDASVTTPDVDASNGVVHIIDKVLMPPGIGLPMKTIPEVASDTADLSTLVTAIQAADLINTLSEPGPLTVFAPTNDAFNALPAGLLESLLKPENKVQLAELLTYHVAPGRIAAGDITDGMQIMTLDGKDNFAKLNATVSGGSVMINDANVQTPNNDASNGVVHIIDKVLIPPGFVAPSTTKNETIVDAAVATPELSTLVTALQAGDLVSTLSGPGPFTVFAPTNDAFNGLKAGLLDSLLKPENKDQLVKLLTYHVASGILLAKDISDGLTITTLEGTELKAKVSGGSVMINDASVTSADIQKSNGVVHIIDKVLIPDSVELAATNLEGDNDGGGSSGGAIAGIVIGVLAVGVLSAFFAMKKLRANQAQKKTAEEYQELNAQISQNPHC